MNRRITIEQLNELDEKQKNNLRKWWKKNFKDGDMNENGLILRDIHTHNNELWIYFYERLNNADSTPLYWDRILPLLDIGQMIELLLDVGFCSNDMIIDKNFCNKLWNNVKSALSNCDFD